MRADWPSAALIVDRTAAERRFPLVIVVDNGPEFASKAFSKWAHRRNVQIHFIDPGKPTQIAFVEPVNGKCRDECLSEHYFENL